MDQRLRQRGTPPGAHGLAPGGVLAGREQQDEEAQHHHCRHLHQAPRASIVLSELSLTVSPEK